ncbi:acyl-CoA reductase [Streptomyces sp. CA2R101]|uniref:acyl-CoA reductase n=1 Tax=Streptomyces sp. CA2R101 TaxID=3120152 RepID=UPI00300B98EB
MNSFQRTTPFYWQGEWIDEAEAERRLAGLGHILPNLAEALSPQTVLAACERLAARLTDSSTSEYVQLHRDLTDPATTALSDADAAASLGHLAHALDPGRLAVQLTAELNSATPSTPQSVSFTDTALELWQPIGTLVHVVPSNVAVAGTLSAVEGLIAGNVNIVKTSGSDGLFTQHALAHLADADPTGHITSRLVVLRFSSRNAEWLEQLCLPADAIAVWGTEEAVAGVGRYAPSGCRLIEWGPKISLAYIDRTASISPAHLRDLARDVFRNGQRTCTSPQVVYVDTSDREHLFSVAEALATALADQAWEFPTLTPTTAEQAEVSNVVAVARLEEHLGYTRTTSAPDGRWHVLADIRPGLCASPLYSTIWVKPLPREDVMHVLHPMRRFLQTVGLAATEEQILPLAHVFFRAGALRVTPMGAMLDTYPGEPHDGQLALQRYSRRVSIA